jgi:hypothetical protein
LVPLLLTATPSLLTSATLKKEENVLRSPVIRDGMATWEGDFWDSDLTTIIKPNGVLEWDLGEVKPIRAGFLQADNNDDYFISGSEDGVTWDLIWKPIPDPIAGMRTRTTTTLEAKARYIRLTASGGDGLYSVGELALWSDPKDLTPDAIARKERPPPARRDASLDASWWIIVLCVAGVAWFYTRKRWEPQAQGATPAAPEAPPAPAPEPEKKDAPKS